MVVKETDPHPSRIGKVILGSALVLALAGIGGGVWWYLRRRREFEDDFEEEDEEDNL